MRWAQSEHPCPPAPLPNGHRPLHHPPVVSKTQWAEALPTAIACAFTQGKEAGTGASAALRPDPCLAIKAIKWCQPGAQRTWKGSPCSPSISPGGPPGGLTARHAAGACCAWCPEMSCASAPLQAPPRCRSRPPLHVSPTMRADCFHHDIHAPRAACMLTVSSWRPTFTDVEAWLHHRAT